MKSNNSYSYTRINEILKKHIDSDNEKNKIKSGKGCPCENKRVSFK